MIGHRAFTREDYFALLRRRWWWILILAILGPIAGYELSLHTVPLYQSQTLLEIELPKVSSNFVTPAVPEYLLMASLGDMEEEILNGRQLKPVLEEFGYSGNVSVPALREAIVLSPSYSPLDSGDAKRPSGFTITCRFRSPQAAQSICSDVASLFMEQNAERQERSASETTAFLTAHLADAQKSLNEQDARLAAFKSRYMNDLPDEVQTNLNLLNSATIQLEGVTEALNRDQSDKEYNESLLAQQLAAWEAQQDGAVGPVPLRVQIVHLENELTDLEGKYKSDYPGIIDLKAQIAWLNKEAQNEAAGVHPPPKPAQKQSENPLTAPPFVQQLRNELRLNAEAIHEETVQQHRLQQQIAAYQSRVQLSPEVEEEYSEITRNHQTALDVYNQLLAKLDASKMAGDLEQRQDSQQFRIIEPATLPGKPISPNPVLFTAAGLGAGLILGLGMVLLLEFRDKSIWNERDIESCVQLLTLATLPFIESPKAKLRAGGQPRRSLLGLGTTSDNGVEHASAKDPLAGSGTPSHLDSYPATPVASGIAEGVPYGTPEINRVLLQRSRRYRWNPDANRVLLFNGLESAFGTEELRTLRTQLELLRKEQRIQSLLITSPLPTEGKTFTALNLSMAIACQANRRVLLIDADMRVPQLHRALGAPLAPGLSECLSGNADELSIIQRGAQNNFFFIPAGKPALNPTDLIGNGRLKLLFRRLAPAFDWIILDSPPAIPISDAQLLAETCDKVLVIFRYGATPLDLAQRACAQFDEKQLLGVVLNRVKSANAYGAYYQKVASHQTEER